MIQAYKEYWIKAFDYKGKTDRKSYLFVIISNMLVGAVLGLLTGLMTNEKALNIMFGIMSLFFILAFVVNIALSVRRIRDIGLRLGWIILFFIPYLSFGLEIMLMVLPSNIRTRKEIKEP
ncbi:DUF805 domain-containing protein [Enterococcus hirae]|nr:DUF805 domain-containing protein [Enterococcus hirae]